MKTQNKLQWKNLSDILKEENNKQYDVGDLLEKIHDIATSMHADVQLLSKDISGARQLLLLADDIGVPGHEEQIKKDAVRILHSVKEVVKSLYDVAKNL